MINAVFNALLHSIALTQIYRDPPTLVIIVWTLYQHSIEPKPFPVLTFFETFEFSQKNLL